MLDIKFSRNILYINNKKLEFDFPIKQVILNNNIYIVLINPEKNNYSSYLNVYGISKEGERLWRIKEIENNPNIYDKIVVEEEHLVIYDIDFFKHIVNPENGEIIKGKIRPLDPITNGKKEFNFNINNDSYKYLFIVAMSFLVLVVISNIFKDFKINTLENKNNKKETVDNVVKTKPKDFPDMIDGNKTNKQNNSELSLIENLDLPDEILEEEKPTPKLALDNKEMETEKDDSKEIKNIDIVKDENKEKEEKSEKAKNDKKYEGINTTVKIFDSLFGAITKGDNVSIKEVNKDGEYTTGDFIRVIDGEHIEVSIDNETNTIKLISVEESSSTIDYLENILSKGDTLYIEQDLKKKNKDNLLGYVWTSKPDLENKDNMINYYLLKNGYAKFKIESPNIKYNRFFN